MGKLRVQDLARMMGIPNQDLVFKLKSIGVRVEGDDAHIDTDIIQAILQGKNLPHPREVILTDQESEASEAATVRRRLPVGRRQPPNPLRPGRPRTLIQRVEPRIQTLPPTQKPPAPPPAPAPASLDEARKAAQARVKRDLRDDKKLKRIKKPAARFEAEGEDLAAYKGSVADIEEAVEVEEGRAQVGGRRNRRAERKQAAKTQAATGNGSGPAFAEGKPEGPVMLSEGMTLRDFAEKLGIKTKDLMKTLFQRGIMANINQVLPRELAEELAAELGVETMQVSFEEEIQLTEEMTQSTADENKVPRAPVVTVMGHVDHGKTSLLDAIRSAKVAEGEAGGITQHIGAYHVDVADRKIVFLDTPGHEAFTMMRARGAQVTDLVVLVVAADDGVMPQTLEAIDHAKAAKVPLVVAINKIDKENANPDRVKKELAERGLLVEDWGGETVAMPISALEGTGIDGLLEMINLTSDILELKGNPEARGQGAVIEASREVGRGTVATVLVQNGTLQVGDVFVSGATWGRVRAMIDDHGGRVKKAGPSTPVEVSGFADLPAAGDTLQVVEDESKARSIAEYRAQQQRARELAPTVANVSLEALFDRMEAGEIKELPVVLKADVQGSVEVLKDTLAKLSTEKVKLEVIHSAVGAISENNVLLASASGAIIIGFNVRPERNAAELAVKEKVDIRLHTVIYEIVDELKAAMTGLLEPTFREVSKGRAEVREMFKIPRTGVVAGSHVVEGVIPRNASVRLLRDNVVMYEGKIGSLRRFKEDASEVRQGFDCGISLERFQDIKPGDEIEAFVQEEVAPEL